jgi:hypothetical protein
MGYTTDFQGSFKVAPDLTAKHALYLTMFSMTRRMKRNGPQAEALPDPARLTVGLPIGKEGGYFVGSGDNNGQNHTPDVLDYNQPPTGQPGLWCQWVPSPDGTAIVWDEGEKFYDYVEWLQYLIEHFLAPWGYKLNGTVKWYGEDHDDRGRIVVKDNVVTTTPRR